MLQAAMHFAVPSACIRQGQPAHVLRRAEVLRNTRIGVFGRQLSCMHALLCSIDEAACIHLSAMQVTSVVIRA